MLISLNREGDDEEEESPATTNTVPRAYSARFPEHLNKAEGWWAVVGDTESNKLLTIKRVAVGKTAKVNMSMTR